jgi:hypothetical protein
MTFIIITIKIIIPHCKDVISSSFDCVPTDQKSNFIYTIFSNALKHIVYRYSIEKCQAYLLSVH